MNTIFFISVRKNKSNKQNFDVGNHSIHRGNDKINKGNLINKCNLINKGNLINKNKNNNNNNYKSFL